MGNIMEYIYERLQQTEYVKDAYERWKEYRDSLTEYVVCSLTKPSRLAIVGAGACNDYDLARLVSKGHEITLIDYDKKAMERGLTCQHIGQGVTVMEMDIFPVQLCGYHGLEELFQKNASYVQLKEYLDVVTGQALQDGWKLPGKFDMVLAAGLHSQLAVAFITLLQEYRRLGKISWSREELLLYQRYVSDINVRLAERIHDEFCASASCFLYGYEYACFQGKDAFIYQIKELFEQGRADVVSQFGISRVEGAYQLEQLLSEELASKRMTIDSVAYFVWPFLKEKQYLLAGCVCRKG